MSFAKEAELKSVRELLGKCSVAITPIKKMTVSEWADKYRMLSPESSVSSGKWRTSRAEYQRGIMDSLSEKGVKEVVIMSSAQVGKTSFIENIIGKFAHNDPSPIMVVNPTVEMSETFSTDRLSTMIRDTPVLTEVFGSQTRRGGGNKILKKLFKGGVLTLVGANSPATLASRPIRIVLIDEVDRFPFSAGTEGDPVNLATKRTVTFWNSLIVMVSTPTIKGLSRIETAFLQSDQRYYNMPCPECGEIQKFTWSQVKWQHEKPETAMYECISCETMLSDVDRYRMVKKGKWIATQPFTKVAGFHLNELYSTWRKLEDIVSDFLRAKGNQETLKTFINTSLGETFEEKGEQGDYVELMSRIEEYGMLENPILHPDCVLITCGVDIQQDRIELEVVGWSSLDESWSLGYHILNGDTASPEVWDDLEKQLVKTYKYPTGRLLNIEMVFVDSGFNTQHVYKFSKRFSPNMLMCIKGMAGVRPIIESRTTKLKRGTVAKHPVEIIGIDNAKHLLMSYLKINTAGAGYCHFTLPYNDEEFFLQITAEKRRTKFIKGFPVMEWFKTRKRNEATDCRVYAMAALKYLNYDLEARKKDFNKVTPERTVAQDSAKVQRNKAKVKMSNKNL